MENYKQTIAKNLVVGNYNLDLTEDRLMNKISEAVSYAWNNWDAEIVATYFEGEKPEYPTEEFVTSWVENEDFEADGYDVPHLKMVFDAKYAEDVVSAAGQFRELYSKEIEAGDATGDTVREWWNDTAEQYPSLDGNAVDSIISKISF